MPAVSEAEKVGAWKFVPVEPTEEMAAAGLQELQEQLGHAAVIVRDPVFCYRAMLHAAPPAPPNNSYHPERDALLVEAIEAIEWIIAIWDEEDRPVSMPNLRKQIEDARKVLARLRATQAKAGT